MGLHGLDFVPTLACALPLAGALVVASERPSNTVSCVACVSLSSGSRLPDTYLPLPAAAAYHSLCVSDDGRLLCATVRMRLVDGPSLVFIDVLSKKVICVDPLPTDGPCTALITSCSGVFSCSEKERQPAAVAWCAVVHLEQHDLLRWYPVGGSNCVGLTVAAQYGPAATSSVSCTRLHVDGACLWGAANAEGGLEAVVGVGDLCSVQISPNAATGAASSRRAVCAATCLSFACSVPARNAPVMVVSRGESAVMIAHPAIDPTGVHSLAIQQVESVKCAAQPAKSSNTEFSCLAHQGGCSPDVVLFDGAGEAKRLCTVSLRPHEEGPYQLCVEHFDHGAAPHASRIDLPCPIATLGTWVPSTRLCGFAHSRMARVLRGPLFTAGIFHCDSPPSTSQPCASNKEEPLGLVACEFSEGRSPTLLTDLFL